MHTQYLKPKKQMGLLSVEEREEDPKQIPTFRSEKVMEKPQSKV